MPFAEAVVVDVIVDDDENDGDSEDGKNDGDGGNDKLCVRK